MNQNKQKNCLHACHVTITDEPWKKVAEFEHFNVFERQTKVKHGKITDWVIIQIKMYVHQYAETLL